MNRGRFAFKIIAGILFFGILLSSLVMLLWNWLMPELFNASEITFLQALGILALSKILFGGFRGWKKGCCHEQCNSGYKGYWRKRWEKKLANMSPEEREKIKAGYKKCCGLEEEGNQKGQ